jgi:hypothetical protein
MITLNSHTIFNFSYLFDRGKVSSMCFIVKLDSVEIREDENDFYSCDQNQQGRFNHIKNSN